MQLFQHVFQLLRDGQAQVSGVLQERDALIGQVEEDHRRAQSAALSQHIHVHQVADAHQHKDEYLPADALKAHGAGQLLVRDGAHHTGDVVHQHEGDQRVEKTVHASQVPAQEAAQGGKGKLDADPD